MKDKHYNNEYDYLHQALNNVEGFEGRSKNHILLSKNDFELYDENKAIPGSVVRIKRIGSRNKNERWRVFENDELKFVVEGDKISKKEREFLRTIDGVSWLIGEFKVGFKNLTELRGRLKKKL